MVYRASALRGLAIAQMVFGALMVVFGVACISSVPNWSSYVGFGIWVGIWVLITGILGYVGARDDNRPNNCLIGCFMGFSITSCVIAGNMFIFYCIAVAEFGRTLRCRSNYYEYPYNTYNGCYYSNTRRHEAAVGAGLGSCLLIFSIVEFFVALAASIYCCNAVCCGAPAVGSVTANQRVMFLQPGQQIYPGGQQGGMIVIQPTGAMATVPQGYAMPGQQAMYVPQQPVSVQLPPAYSMQPAGATPAGMVTMSYAGAMPTQTQVQGPPKDHERPPPYAFTQGGNAPPSASVSGAAAGAGMPGVMEV